MFLVSVVACGGGNVEPNGPARDHQAAIVRVSSAAMLTAGDYKDLVQQIYVAYFGRPADAAGLLYFENLLLAARAPTTLPELVRVYDSNAAVKAILDTFANSTESALLYPGNNSVFILAVYTNLFNRVADAPGLAYWSNLISQGAMSRASAAVNIMNGARGADLDIITNKTTVASRFTASLDSDAKIKAYSGLVANAAVRIILNSVEDSTDTAGFQHDIDAVIERLLAAAAAPVATVPPVVIPPVIIPPVVIPPVVTPPVVIPPIVVPPVVTLPPSGGKQCYVNGYYRKNGTYVSGYYRSC
jgi:hypothetical protein